MAEPTRLVEPAASFASTDFWRRLTQGVRGHDDHPLMLVGSAESTARYDLRCDRCDSRLVEVLVDRAAV